MLSKEELKEMYWGQGMTQSEIASEIDVSHTTVVRWMMRYEIEARTHSESILYRTTVISENELRQMYWNQGMTQNEIGVEIGVSVGTVNALMVRYGIESRTMSNALIDKFTGVNASAWKGGISFEPYCNKFNKKFKESVCERDDYTCQLCGYKQKLGDRRLSVHHIHYDKENCYPDVVALCRSCNSRVNGNRDYWEQYFEDQLVARGLLN